MTRNAYSYRTDETRSRKPLAILVVALLAIIAIAIYLGMTFLGPANVSASKAQTDFDQVPATPVAEESVVAEDVIMTLGGSQDTYVLTGEEYLEAGCHAVQEGTGDITSAVATEGDVDTTKPGTYEVTYTATTSDGKTAEATRTVHVVDSFDAKAASLPVLMYHYVYSADNPPSEVNGNYILDTKLAEQCAYLKENDYYFPSYQEVEAFAKGTHSLPAKSVVLTFDDGEMGFLQTGIPVLEEYEVPATSFVVAKDASTNVIDYASEFVTFQSHSYNMHRAGGGAGQGGIIHAMSKQEIYDDIMLSNEVTGGEGAVALAYPFGDNHEIAWEALQDAGVLCAFTVKNDRIRPGDNPLALNRVRVSSEYSLDSFINLVAPAAA